MFLTMHGDDAAAVVGGSAAVGIDAENALIPIAQQIALRIDAGDACIGDQRAVGGAIGGPDADPGNGIDEALHR